MLKSIDYDLENIGKFQDKAFIMIHGWKGNKNSFKSIGSLMRIPNSAWYYLEAPYQVDGDKTKKTWTYQLPDGSWEDKEPKRLLMDFLNHIVFKKFESKDVYIMGFSQGAAVCFEFILTLDYSFGGIFPIAGFIRDPKADINISLTHRETLIVIGHGKDDDVIPVKAAEIAYNIIKKTCKNVKLHIYNGKHKIGMEYIKKIRSLIVEGREI